MNRQANAAKCARNEGYPALYVTRRRYHRPGFGATLTGTTALSMTAGAPACSRRPQP
jgi:hypothetical protein